VPLDEPDRLKEALEDRQVLGDMGADADPPKLDDAVAEKRGEALLETELLALDAGDWEREELEEPERLKEALWELLPLGEGRRESEAPAL